MVLLHLLAELPRDAWSLTVAHLNHGMRDDAAVDEALVAHTADKLNLRFESIRFELRGQSENAARQARYHYLESVRARVDARGIMTAHHADDRLETAYYNTLRGSGSRGLVALRSHGQMVRPLLGVAKTQIRKFALDSGIKWHEDSTNSDLTITRNYLRRELLAHMPKEQRQLILTGINKLEGLQDQIEAALTKLVSRDQDVVVVSRAQAGALSTLVRHELVMHLIRLVDPSAEVSEPLVNRLALAIKTGRTGQVWPITRRLQLAITKTEIRVSEVKYPLRQHKFVTTSP